MTPDGVRLALELVLGVAGFLVARLVSKMEKAIEGLAGDVRELVVRQSVTEEKVKRLEQETPVERRPPRRWGSRPGHD